METFYIEKYTIKVYADDSTRAGDKVDVEIRLTDGNKYAAGYRVCRFVDDTMADLAKRAFCHYKLGDAPDMIQTEEKPRTSAAIRASIEVNKQTFEQASATLREILDESEPRRPYHLERMITSLNLCSDIAKHRAKLESELQKAIQAGR